MTPYANQDLAALRVLDAGLGGFSVLKIEENRMTEQAPEDFTGGDDGGWGEATGANAPAFPELPSNPHNHVYTWSPKLGDGSMLVVRANTADELASAVEALVPVSGRLKAAWAAVSGGGAPAPQAPAQQPWQQQPAQPVPNQPYPGQPAWRQAGAPQAPAAQWTPPTPAANVPQGWYRLDVPFKPRGNNPGKPGFDAIVQQYNFKKDDPSRGGQVSFQKGTKSWYCAPDIAGAFQQFNPVVSQ